jgi:alpha(1,3/1,4) fucosyltransferase
MVRAMGYGLKPMDVDVYFDPPTHHLYSNRLFDREGNIYAGDNILAPYAAVYKRLRSQGINVQTADFLPATSAGRRALVISFGTPDRLVAHSVKKYRALARRPDVTLSAFFAMECPIVEPTMYRALPRLEQCFRRIFSWSDTKSLLQFTRKPVCLEHFCWPQSFDAVHEHLWSNQDRKFLVMINANKLPRLYVDELYTARLRAVEFFGRYGEIDLYGRNWDGMPARMGKVPTPVILRRAYGAAWRLGQRLWPNPLYAAAARLTRGSAPSKSATLAQYRFALCFENSVLRGWLTEKLFDCFFAGTVPVYLGTPDVLDWVPADCFIDMRQFTDFAELRAFLHALPLQRLQQYREAARAYLASDRFKPFRLEAFADLVASIVADDAGIAA